MFSLQGMGERKEGATISEQYIGSNNINNYLTSNTIEKRSPENNYSDSRLGNYKMDGGSGDKNDDDNKSLKKKPYIRHTSQQIQELKSLFKECSHPDAEKRLEFSQRLCLEPKQVKFWFQNHRTQMKAQLERQMNSFIKQENDKLRTENISIWEEIRNSLCMNCGGLGNEGQHLRSENAQLKDKIKRMYALLGDFLGGPTLCIADPISSAVFKSSLELRAVNNGFPLGDFSVDSGGIERSLKASMYLELALAAMDELVKMAQTDDPLWFNSLEGGRDELNHEEYLKAFNPCIGLRPNGYVSEASRETVVVKINSVALIDTLMDSNRWAETFPCVIASTTKPDVILSGTRGTRNGELQLMYAELQVLSPLVPIRKTNFLRFCKQHPEGIWAVVDVSINCTRDNSVPTFGNCRRLPSGCVVQDMTNGYSKVTWVEHAEYDENVIHRLYRPFIGAGMGFGAQRWVATLQRQCECITISLSAVPTEVHSAITDRGKRNMAKLAQHMTNNFCAGICASTMHKWNKLTTNMDNGVQVMTQKSLDDLTVLSAATSVWLPVSPQRLFDLLGDEQLRRESDILSSYGPMQEMAHFAKGEEDLSNRVSLLCATAMNTNQSSMFILQETSTDAVGSVMVFAPVDMSAMHEVLKGGDSSHVVLLPSGFVILPGGPTNSDEVSHDREASGSLLTVAFQISVSCLPTAKHSEESVETVNDLMLSTVQKIKASLQYEM